MENNNLQKQKFCIEIADVQLTILSDESEEFVQETVRLLDTQIRELTVHNKRCAKIDAAILCALDSLGEKIKLEKKLRNLQAQIDLYEANLRRLRADAEPAPAGEAPAVQETPAKAEEKAETAGKAEEKPAPKTKKQPAKPAVQQLSVEEAADEPKAEEVKAEVPSAEPAKAEESAPVEEPKNGVRDDKLKQIESLLRRRSEAPAEDASESKHDDKLREIEELLRVGGGRSLSEALKDARES